MAAIFSIIHNTTRTVVGPDLPRLHQKVSLLPFFQMFSLIMKSGLLAFNHSVLWGLFYGTGTIIKCKRPSGDTDLKIQPIPSGFGLFFF